MGKCILIASGKGGVGKSSISAALGRSLADSGHRVCIVDMDIGLRGQDAFLGLEDRIVFDSHDVQSGLCNLQSALMDVNRSGKLFLLAAPQFSRVKELEPNDFRDMVQELLEQFDFVIIDCPAGIERGLRGTLKAPIHEILIVCTPDSLCIRDAERVISVVDKKSLPRPRLIVNRLIPGLIEKGEMYSARICADSLDIQLVGEIPDDLNVYRAQLNHLSIMDIDCPARDAIVRISRRICGEQLTLPGFGKRRPWYRRMWDFMLESTVKEVKRIDR